MSNEKFSLIKEYFLIENDTHMSPNIILGLLTFAFINLAIICASLCIKIKCKIATKKPWISLVTIIFSWLNFFVYLWYSYSLFSIISLVRQKNLTIEASYSALIWIELVISLFIYILIASLGFTYSLEGNLYLFETYAWIIWKIFLVVIAFEIIKVFILPCYLYHRLKSSIFISFSIIHYLIRLISASYTIFNIEKSINYYIIQILHRENKLNHNIV
jgi:hypothetical protein